ncbi:hypothetical protein DdX_20851 [Ditylenchus destructor]|uniref:Uncharacterized protein n=1 Tax=Ditylenchus destructor TaxID=166010 RepID=A0AAD4QVS5_9BILA|nr:hypothetical protein DdX_20851 [Ditylenchus destructor]
MNELHAEPTEVKMKLEQKLTATFTYEELKRYIDEVRRDSEENLENITFLQQALWLASSHYEMTFSLDTSISERVIFPIADTEKRGIGTPVLYSLRMKKRGKHLLCDLHSVRRIQHTPQAFDHQRFLPFQGKNPSMGRLPKKGRHSSPEKSTAGMRCCAVLMVKTTISPIPITSISGRKRRLGSSNLNMPTNMCNRQLRITDRDQVRLADPDTCGRPDARVCPRRSLTGPGQPACGNRPSSQSFDDSQ